MIESSCLRQDGMILMMTMVYLLAATLLITATLDTAWLQTNMAQHFMADSQALANAETALLIGEESIRGDELQGSKAISPQMNFEFQQRPDGVCGAIYYQVTAVGTYAHAQRRVESILQIPLPEPPDCPSGIPLRRRLAWYQEI